MDLDLFGAFEGEENVDSIAPVQNPAGRSKKRRDNDDSANTKRVKVSTSAEKTQSTDEETTIITTSMTSTSETGTTLTKVPLGF